MSTVTPTPDAPLPPHECPFDWCEAVYGDGSNARDHHCSAYIPATASVSTSITDPFRSEQITVGVVMRYEEGCDIAPQVGIHIYGDHRDADAYMQINEASVLYHLLAEAIRRARSVLAQGITLDASQIVADAIPRAKAR